MLVKQTELPQTLNQCVFYNRANNLAIGFHLISETNPKPKDCNFPLVTVKNLGVSNYVSARLIWTPKIKPALDLLLTDALDATSKVVYNLLKSQCNDKNKYQLYVSTLVEGTQNVIESFVAEGFIYVYLN